MMQVKNTYQQTAARLAPSPGAMLYERHAVPILAYLRLRAPTLEDAEDVLQEVFLAAMDQRQLVNISERQQLAWLSRVAQRKLIDHYRRLRRRSALPLEQIRGELEEESLVPELVILLQEEQRELWESVKHLSTLQQQVVYLRFVGGLHYPQIARRLGKSEDAVRKHLSRAMNQLRERYQHA